MRRSLMGLVFIGCLALLTACGGAGSPGGSRAGENAGSSAPVRAVSLPESVSAFTFAGAPTAVTGGMALDISGVYEFTSNAVSFDGLTGSLASEGPGSVHATETFSVSAWVSLAEKVEYAAAVSQIGDESAAFYLGIGESTWDFAMKDADTNDPGHTVRAKADSGLVHLDQWVHLVGVHDKEAGVDRLYVDAQRAAETPFDAAWQANGPLTIGRSQAHGIPSDFWPGAIASVAIYPAALSSEQIAYLYASTLPIGAPPPIVQPKLHGNALLNGTWDFALDDADAQWVRDGFAGMIEPGGQQVTVRLGFDGATWWQGFLFDGELFLLNGDTEGDGGTLDFVGDQVIMIGAGGTARVTYAWSLQGEALTLTVVEQCDSSTSQPTCTTDRSEMDADLLLVTEHTFTRSGDDATY